MSLDAEMTEAIQETVRVFDGLKLCYAIGGAVAMAFGGYARGTHDLDVLILLPALRSQELADALNSTGFRMLGEREIHARGRQPGEAALEDARQLPSHQASGSDSRFARRSRGRRRAPRRASPAATILRRDLQF